MLKGSDANAVKITNIAEPTEAQDVATKNYVDTSITDNLPTFSFYYADKDEDGFGCPWNVVYATSAPTGFVTTNTDCDDNDDTVYPGAPGIDGIGQDINCDGTVGVPKVGDYHQGGIVFYVFKPGDSGFVNNEHHGLICALSDVQATSWGCSGTLIGGTSTDLGNGMSNSNAIKAGCSDSTNAVSETGNYSFTSGGQTYLDWYLPSIDELEQLATNKTIVNTKSTENGGDLLSRYYWSSSEENANSAFEYDFNLNVSNSFAKRSTSSVRPIRTY